MPGSRFYLLVGLAAVLLVPGLVQPLWIIAALALDLVAVLLYLVDWLRVRGYPLEARRVWPPMLAQGAPAQVVVELDPKGPGLLEVEMREGLHPALAPEPLRRRVVLRPGTINRWVYDLVPRNRGEVTVLPLTARLRGRWGFAWTQRELIPAETVKIFPQIRWEGRVGHLLALAQRHQLGTMPLRWQGLGTEHYGLREYLPGDPLNRIHWKATARHGRLVSREETWERGSRLVILLDAARTMTAKDGQRNKLDHSLAAALALTRVAASRGDRVTLVAFSDRVEKVVRCSGGSRGLAAVYASLYGLQARLVEPAYDLATEQVFALEGRSATVVLFTSVVDLAAAELLKESLLRLETRHRPMLVNLQDPEIQALATAAPRTEPEAFAQVSALEILLANGDLARRLRRAGVRVVNTPADRLALETLEAYLAFFRAQLRRTG